MLSFQVTGRGKLFKKFCRKFRSAVDILGILFITGAGYLTDITEEYNDGISLQALIFLSPLLFQKSTNISWDLQDLSSICVDKTFFKNKFRSILICESQKKSQKLLNFKFFNLRKLSQENR